MATLSITRRCIECQYAEYRYAKGPVLFIVLLIVIIMLNVVILCVIVLNVIMLSVILQSVILLNVVAPFLRAENASSCDKHCNLETFRHTKRPCFINFC